MQLVACRIQCRERVCWASSYEIKTRNISQKSVDLTHKFYFSRTINDIPRIDFAFALYASFTKFLKKYLMISYFFCTEMTHKFYFSRTINIKWYISHRFCTVLNIHEVFDKVLMSWVLLYFCIELTHNFQIWFSRTINDISCTGFVFFFIKFWQRGINELIT